jgi:hypothetical protein
MVVGNVCLLLSTDVCRTVSHGDGVRRSDIYVYIYMYMQAGVRSQE